MNDPRAIKTAASSAVYPVPSTEDTLAAIIVRLEQIVSDQHKMKLSNKVSK